MKRTQSGHLMWLAAFLALMVVLVVGCGNDDDEAPTVPPPVKGLSHTITRGAVTLHWNAVTDAVTYRVSRAVGDGKYKVLDTTDSTSYTDTDVVAGTSYTYRVAAISAERIEGEPSLPYQVRYEEGVLQVPESLSAEGIDLGETDSSYDLKFENVGGLLFEWTLKSEDTWIVLGETEGTLEPGDEHVVRLSIQRPETPDEYRGAVILTSDDTGQVFRIPIQMAVAEEPRIGIEPIEIAFVAPEDTPKLKIENLGTGTLTWKAENVPNWLEVKPLSGDTGKQPSDVQLSVLAPQTLDPDTTYTAALVLKSNDQTNPAVTVTVSIQTPPLPPRLLIRSGDKHLMFPPGEVSRQITISNVGGGILNWDILVEPISPWLRVQPTQGQTEVGQPDVLTFTVDPNQGRPGEVLKATVTVDAGTIGREQIVVEVRIPEEKWSLSPAVQTVAPGEVGRVILENVGLGSLEWSVTSVDTWLQPAEKNGLLDAGRTHTLEVQVDVTQLELGQHTGKLIFTTAGGKSSTVEIQTTKVTHIQGAAYNSRTGSLVRDAQISIDGGPSRVFTTGKFKLERTREGAFTLRAEHSGYIGAEYEGIVDALGNVDFAELWLRPLPQVVSSFHDPAGELWSPIDVAFSPDGSRAYVSDELAGVFSIDTQTDTFLAHSDTAQHPLGVAVHPDGGEVYLADAESHQILVLDPNTLAVRDAIGVERYPQYFVVSMDGRWLYVACRDADMVVSIDLELHQRDQSFPVGRDPYSVALSPSGMLYVTNAGDSTVTVLDPVTATRLATIPVASNPQYIVASQDNVYVSDAMGDNVSIIDQGTNQVVESVVIGNGILLGDLVVVEDERAGDMVYVLNISDGTLRVIDMLSLMLVPSEIRLGNLPTAIAYEPSMGKFYVTDGGTSNVLSLVW